MPFRNAPELVSYAKANPGKLNYGAPIGIGPHFLMELFKIKSGARIQHVPYRGSGPIIADVIGGQIQLMMAGKSVLLPLVQSGKLRAIAVARGEALAGAARGRHADRGRLPRCRLRHDLRDRGADGHARRRDPGAQHRDQRGACARTMCARASTSSASIRRSRRVAEFNALVAAEAPRWAEVVRVTGIKAGE